MTMTLTLTTTPQTPRAIAHPIPALSILTAVCLCGYALMNLLAMPALSPGAFVPKTLTSPGGMPFAILQVVFVLGFAFAFLPVVVMLTIRRYQAHPQWMIVAGVLLSVALLLEIDNNLPVLGGVLYPEALAAVPADVALRLRQASAIRYLSFDVAGFSILYGSLLLYAAIFWKTHRLLGVLTVSSVVVFAASAPLLWVNGAAAMILLVVAVLLFAPVPVVLGRLAGDGHSTCWAIHTATGRMSAGPVDSAGNTPTA